MIPESPPVIRIGTRQSKLALAQAHSVRKALLAQHPALECVLVPMTTTGDRITDRTLADIGGKGLFAKELDEALRRGDIDLAVHSAKDLESFLSSDISFISCTEREDNRDVFVAHDHCAFSELPYGARIGTSSVRRAAQALRKRPDLHVGLLRGNVPTRLEKIASGEADGTFLALAGLKRLEIPYASYDVLPHEQFLPAACQGIIGITCRTADVTTRTLLAPINHAPTYTAAQAERALLAALDGSCRTPIAAWARLEEGALRLSGALYAADGSETFTVERIGNAADAARLGQDAGEELKARGRHVLA